MVPGESEAPPGWLRNLVMLVALAGWAAAVVAIIAAKALPDPVILGIPAFLWGAMWGIRIKRSPGSEE